MPILEITQDNFATQVEASAKPVLVEFTAPWCGYCKRLNPVFNAVAEAFVDKMIVGTINVDEHEPLEDRFEVMTIPTLMLFTEGQPGTPLVNPGSRAQIDMWLSEQGVK